MSNININNLTPLSGNNGKISISGSLHVKNDVTLGGNISLGDANTDTVVYVADVSSSIVPDADNKYNLGQTTKRWGTAHIATASLGLISGSVQFTDDLTLSGGTLTVSGSVTISGSSTFSNYGQFNNYLMNSPFAYGNQHFIVESKTLNDAFGGTNFANPKPYVIFKVTASGHVGVGTLAPKHTLHVSSSQGNWNSLYVEGDANFPTQNSLVTITTGSLGKISSSILPVKDSSIFDIGTPALRWRSGSFTGVVTASVVSMANDLLVGGQMTFTGAGRNILHQGDPDTKITFTNDQIDFVVGGVTMLKLDEGGHDVSTYTATSHKFIGNVTASGNISASLSSAQHVLGGSTKFGNKLANTLVTIDGNNGHITASGNIKAIGTVTASQLESAGNVTVANNIIHKGDTNTKIAFGTDTTTITVGGLDMITMTEAANPADTIALGTDTSVAGHITASGNITASAIEAHTNVTIGNKLIHKDDVDTYVQFTTNKITNRVGGGDILTLGASYLNSSKFIGDITASGDISASGNVYGAQGIFGTGTTTIDDDMATTGHLKVGLISTHNGHVTASGDISASGESHTFGGTTRFGVNKQNGLAAGRVTIDGLEGHITASGGISASGFVRALAFSAVTGIFGTGTTTINDNLSTTGHITASGNITASQFEAQNGYHFSNIGEGASQDLATSNNYNVNGSKFKVRAILAAQLNDGTFAKFKIKNTSIEADSVIHGAFIGNYGNSSITGSILSVHTISAKSASVFIHNENGNNIPNDTAFTASFVIL